MHKGLRIFLYVLLVILFLLTSAIVYLNTPWGQNFVRGKAEAFLNKKLKTEVRIGELGYGLPKFIVLRKVLVLDQAKDTLLAVGELKIDLNMWQLIHKEVSVSKILLKSVHAHIYRNQPDTNFNFTYIIDAFAGKPSETPAKAKDTTSSPLKIDVDLVKLDDIHFRFDDHTGGVALQLNLEQAELKMKELNFDKMLFHIKNLAIAGLQSTFVEDSSLLPKQLIVDTTPTKLQLIADNVDLKQITFTYNSTVSKMLFALKLGALNLQLNRFGLENSLVDIKKLAIDNTDIALYMGKKATVPPIVDTILHITTPVNWQVKAGDINFNSLKFRMDDENAVRVAKGIDYAHLNGEDINLNLHDLHYSTDSISGNVKHLALKEQSGIDVQELKTKFTYNEQGAVLKNLYLRTSRSVIQHHLEIHYPSIAAIQKDVRLIRLNLNVDSTVIAVQDVLIFAPILAEQDLFRKYKNGTVKLAAVVTGALDNLNIAQFYAAGLSGTEVALSGKLNGLPEPDQLKYNFHIAKLQSNSKDIHMLVADSLLTSVRIPDQFGLTGDVAGTIKDYKAELFIMSTDGLAYIKGIIATSPGKNKEQYDILAKTSNLNIGRILKQDSVMSTVTALISAKGKSFDVKTMTADIGGKINSANIKGYRYHDIKLLANVDKQKGKIDFLCTDPNLQVQLNGKADFSGQYAAVTADIKLDSIDIQALKFYKTELRARGVIHVDFPVLNPDYPEGSFVWWDPVITANGTRYYMDSMTITSKPDNVTGQNMVLNLDMLSANITGKMPLTKIMPIVQERMERYYKIPLPGVIHDSVVYKPISSDSTFIATNLADYNLNVVASVVDKPLLHSLLPGLTSFDSIHVDANLTPQKLSLNVLVPLLEYGTMVIEDAKVAVLAVDSGFTYSMQVEKVSQGDMALYFASVKGNLDQSVINTTISLADAAKKERYSLKATLRSAGDSQLIQLLPGLMLNYNTWNVTPENHIVLANGGFYVKDFQIDNSGQSIKINSSEAAINKPLRVDIANFSLANITEAISKKDTLLAAGTLGGSVVVNTFSPDLNVTADLKVKQLLVLGDTLGDLQINADTKEQNAINTNITLKGYGNDIAVTGPYYLKQNNGNDFDFKLKVNALALHSFETIAQRQIRNSSGYVRGELAIKGTTSAPKITGELKTDNLMTTVSELNASFKMPNEKVTFTETGITLNNFTILDSAGSKAVFNGTVNTTNLDDVQLDLTVKARNWHAINSSIENNKVFYGDLFLTSDIKVTGKATAPSVDGSIKILKGTNLTVVTPETTTEMQDTKGIVIFMNMKDTDRLKYLVAKKKKPVPSKIKAGAGFNVNVTVDKAAQFNLIVDQASGDLLSIKGDATLNAAVNAGGTMSLTGNYALSSGTYQLNYNFIKRKFAINDGSTITFAGDPIKGTTLNVTATYEAMVPPLDLVQRQIADPAQLNYYKQRLPFNVNLHMNGPILTPHLSFDVLLPENKVYPLSADQLQLIQSKLSQVRTDTSELNKQVFALLILNRFVADNPFNASAGSSPTFTALQSVSTFIGEQLNQAAGKLVKGIDFSVDLGTTEDYTTGDLRRRTDLNLAASKRLLNDRLKLTIGNDFELEGPQTGNSQKSTLVPTNLAADYLLSADGRYTLRAYRRSFDQGVLQGLVTETGVNFIVSLDYDNFKKAFFRKNKNKSKKTK